MEVAILALREVAEQDMRGLSLHMVYHILLYGVCMDVRIYVMKGTV